MGNTEILSYSKAGFYLAAGQAENYDKEFRKDYSNYNYRIVELQLQREDDGSIYLLFSNLKDDTLTTKMPEDTTIEDAIKIVKKTFENSQGNDETNWKIIQRDELTMDSTLKDVMEEESEISLYVSFEVKGLPNFPNSPIKCTEKLAEPFDNNFCYYQFVNQGSDSFFQIYKPKKSILESFNLDRYSKNSTYCNGIDHLFISGGIDQDTKEQTNDFWDIDLNTNVIYHHEIGLPMIKKNHSMIFVPNQYVFFVGGDEVETFFYDTQSQTFSKWANLNQKTASPSLAIYKNRYLVCIPNQKNKENEERYYEYTDLRGEPKWEKKIIEYDEEPKKWDQRYSALCPFGDHHILSVGGIFNKHAMEDILASGNELIPVAQFSSNVDKEDENDKMEKTDIESKKYTFKEKTFSQIDDDLYGMLPIFPKQEPKIVVFDQGKRQFEERKFSVLEGGQELIGGRTSFVPKFKFTTPDSDNCLKGKLGLDVDLNKSIEEEVEEEEPPKVVEPPKVEEPVVKLRAKKKKQKPNYDDLKEELNRNLHNIHSPTDYEAKVKPEPEPEPEPIVIEEKQEEPEPEPEPLPEPKLRAKKKVEEPPVSNKNKGRLLKSSIINQKEELGIRSGDMPGVSKARNKQSAIYQFQPGFSTVDAEHTIMKGSVNVGMGGKRSQIFS